MSNNTKLSKILIVEDDPRYCMGYTSELRDKVELLLATTISEGQLLFQNNPDVAVIIMDACIPGDYPNTLELTEEIRKSFQGPMIAASGSSYYRQMLITAGCNHNAPKDKAAKLALNILGIA